MTSAERCLRFAFYRLIGYTVAAAISQADADGDAWNARCGCIAADLGGTE